MSINQFIIDGNVTRDVELRATPRGTAVASYTVAVDNIFYVGDERRHETDYILVTSYGRQAENDAKYLKKGSSVTVMGRIRSWHKPDQKKSGFNFEAQRTIYRGCPSTSTDSVEDGREDAWLKEYAGAERARGDGSAPTFSQQRLAQA